MNLHECRAGPGGFLQSKTLRAGNGIADAERVFVQPGNGGDGHDSSSDLVDLDQLVAHRLLDLATDRQVERGLERRHRGPGVVVRLAVELTAV